MASESNFPNGDLGPSKLGPEYVGFDHMKWYVGNAKQAASYYVTRLGFREIAYMGPETGSRVVTARVVTSSAATFVLMAPARGLPEPDEDNHLSDEERRLLFEIHEHLTSHGDGVKDVAFQVKGDITPIWTRAISHGAIPVKSPKWTWSNDAGDIQTATIGGAYGDTTHTLVNRENYQGSFMPGYVPAKHEDLINQYLPTIDLIEIDHCVGNQSWDGVDPVAKFYEDCLDFYRYWTVDDTTRCSEYSAMRSIVVASRNDVIKMPLNEPAVGKRKSQIEEFVEFYNGAGVQHIAFRTDNIITAVVNLKQRGLEFLNVPTVYYEDMRRRLKSAGLELNESIDELEKLNILIDFDEGGYLLQIFAKHVVDRPTVFFEVIQRNNFDGFGAGNFKALFEAFEREQVLRGNI